MSTSSTTICVCGAGTMGSGIAQVFAQHGFVTSLFDVDEQTLQKAREKVSKKLADAAITYTTQLNDCVADVIIEAIVEKAEVKAQLFNRLAECNPPTSIFATNTSSLSVTAIAAQTARRQQVVGLHFFNPAAVMKLVEVIRTEYVAQEVIDTVMRLAVAVGKTPVLCTDAPGFIVNHVARPYYLESLRIAESNAVEPEIIDRLMETTGFKMGPFRLMDLIGNDINYAVSCIVHDALGRPARLQPSILQQKKVEEGHLGRKTGKGYYDYSTT